MKMTVKAQRNVRKVNNEARRAELGDIVNSAQSELRDLIEDYNEIIEEEEDELNAQGYVKLYEVPRESWVSLNKDPKTLFFFDHIDGAYSFCLCIDGSLQHIDASTPVLVHALDLDAPER